MKEGLIQTWVVKSLEKAFPKLYIFKVGQGQYLSRRGIPDLIACIEGHFIAIEVKTEIGKLTRLQEHELMKIKASGGLSVVMYGKDEKDMERLIKIIKKLTE